MAYNQKGCDDCEQMEADPGTDEPICNVTNMKAGCKTLLKMIGEVV